MADSWATKVRDALVQLNDAAPSDLRVWQLDKQLEIEVRGSVGPRYDQSCPIGRSRSNRVEFQIVEQVIPGEHGFRFFPSFYRHLFDTMRRTPILHPNGDATGATAFDQLVLTPNTLLALGAGEGPRIIQMRQFRSIHRLQDTLRLMCEQVGFTLRDLLGVQFHMLRYLLSSADRRLLEAEPVNVLNYLGGIDPARRYSKKALAFIDRAPRALAAMSATEADARTQFDITAQLMVAPPAEGATGNMTLNGPTSTVWLEHWKAYLKIQGVKFFVGKVKSLRKLGEYLVPALEGPHGLTEPLPEDAYHAYMPPSEGDPEGHRFVLALSYQQASDLIWEASASNRGQAGPPDFSGPFDQVMKFDSFVGRRINDQPQEPARDPTTGKPQGPAKGAGAYPLRTISGLQYFFPEEYRFGQGNVYFVSSPWGLTSISQFAYWRQRIRPVGTFLGQISVDVGDWHAFYPPAQLGASGVHGNTAWYSSRNEVAQNTWQQIKTGLARDYADVVDVPRFFHIDRKIVFEDASYSGYQGSAQLRISKPVEPGGPAVGNILTFEVTFGKWSRYEARSEPLQVPFGRINDNRDPMSAATLEVAINMECKDAVYALRHGGSETDLFVSPQVTGPRFVIAFRTPVTYSYLVVNGKSQGFEAKGPEERRSALEQVVKALDPTIEVRELDKAQSTFEITADKDFRLSVMDVEGSIELLDGPQLSVYTSTQYIRQVNAMHPGSGRVTEGAVRANAVLRLPSGTRVTEAPHGIQAGRLYGVEVGIGGNQARLMAKYIADPADTPARVRDALLEDLTAKAGEFVLARPRGETDIVLSPIVAVPQTTVDVLRQSNQPFVILIDGRLVEVDGAGKNRVEICSAIATEIRGRVEGDIEVWTSGRSLSLARPPGHARPTFRLSVLNVDRCIELVGAPALTVEVKDLLLEQPAEGFVVMRNDGEFLINIPDQWSHRPGLCRDAGTVPDDYRRLASLFGDEQTEIFYGPGADCKLLKYWVPAGTYMATYTRMTTMEAANESGRHAASAIIHSVSKKTAEARHAAGMPPILVGDLPQTWKVEDYEPEDLKYFTELDKELFKAGLPHVLDILSVTELVNAVLETDLPAEQTLVFIAKCQEIMDHVVKGPTLGALAAGGQAVTGIVEASSDLIQHLRNAITGTDVISDVARAALTRQLADVTRLGKYYRGIWFRDG